MSGKTPLEMKSRTILRTWLPRMRKDFLRTVPDAPGLAFYGTGESAHWAVQSNMNTAAALAVAGTLEQDAEAIDTALRLFRYAMRTHRTGDRLTTDGAKWGGSWISILGMERMAHGVNALRAHWNEEDERLYRQVRFSEADFLLRELPVTAGMIGESGNNRPESNIWNGGFLWRAALDYPDATDAAQWREKGTRFLLNGISHALDAASEKLFSGRPLRDWHTGFNFTPNYSLDHHGYMNVGYSIICLSNIAMLHYNFRERGQTAPEALYHHAADLWDTVRHFFFDDGRLLRIGGDTRTRYTYCQCYAVPALLFAADYLSDPDALRLKEGYLELLRREQEYNGDGTFYGKRLKSVREHSFYYYSRLESDPALALSMDWYWRTLFPFPEAQAGRLPERVWSDEYHGAHLLKTDRAIRTFCVRGSSGSALALCVPRDRSDLAEWSGNLLCRFGLHQAAARPLGSSGRQGADFFVRSGAMEWLESAPLGEGEGRYRVAESRYAVAALPDGKSMIVLEYVKILKETTFESIVPVHFQVPNDLFNGGVRCYKGENFLFRSDSPPEKSEEIDTGTWKLTIDGRVAVAAIGGMESLHLLRSPEREAEVFCKPLLKSLFIETIAARALEPFRRLAPGSVPADTAVAVAVDPPEDFCMEREWIRSGMLRGAVIRGCDGIRYRLLADFGDAEHTWEGLRLAPGEAVLQRENNGVFHTL